MRTQQQCRSCLPVRLLIQAVMVSMLACQADAWGSSSNSDFDESVYGNSFTRDWLYDSSLSFQVEGCVWGYVEDSEESGCLEDSSEDGTTNWYMMANCRRPQVAYSVYASSGSGSASCNSNNFVGSFVTKGGVSEFIYYLTNYGGASFYGDDDNFGDDGAADCGEGYNGGYVGLDCTDDGQFALNYFNDQYCISRTGSQYDQLSNVNSFIKSYKSCTKSYSYGDSTDNSLIHKLVYYSEPCTSMDYNVCTDNSVFEERSSSSGRGSFGGHHHGWSSRAYMGGHKSWVTKLKYVVGGLFLLASFIMFTGILFTNRRRRRAMMMRKYRQAKKQRREKSRDGSRKSRSGSKKRSKSRPKESKPDGVLT